MGLADHLEKRTRQTWLTKRTHRIWLKLAMDMSWIAATGIGMVFGPLMMVMLQSGNSNRAAIEQLIDRWLAEWQEIQNKSDHVLGQSRDDYGVRSHAVLLPILSGYQQRLRAIRSAPYLDDPAMLTEVIALHTDAVHNFSTFNEWVESEGALIGFDAAKYRDEAVRKAHKFWEPIVREISKAMG